MATTEHRLGTNLRNRFASQVGTKIAHQGYTLGQVAVGSQIAEDELHDKLNGKADFTATDLVSIAYATGVPTVDMFCSERKVVA